jgi:hypothetical protein
LVKVLFGEALPSSHLGSFASSLHLVLVSSLSVPLPTPGPPPTPWGYPLPPLPPMGIPGAGRRFAVVDRVRTVKIKQSSAKFTHSDLHV